MHCSPLCVHEAHGRRLRLVRKHCTGCRACRKPPRSKPPRARRLLLTLKNETRTRRMFMLRKVSNLAGYSIKATDDELGKIKEVYFDDECWGIRYLVVETGTWLSRRLVLISPYSITGVDDLEEIVTATVRDRGCQYV